MKTTKIYDMHTHTGYSDDCDYPMEQLVRAAFNKGLPGIAITDHYDPGYPDPEFPFVPDFNAYHAGLEKIQAEYTGRMDILKGLELGLMDTQLDAGEKAVAAYDYDFVIASFHCYRGDDLYKLDYSEKDRTALFQDFFLSMYEMLSLYKNYDIIGHFTIIDRYIGDIFDLHPAMDIIRETLKLIIDDGKGIEINTSHLKYEMPVLLPRLEILKLYRELGGEILTIGSDTHDPYRYGQGFAEAIALAKSLGFRYYTIFHDRKPELLPFE